jgi:hypothetical protein
MPTTNETLVNSTDTREIGTICNTYGGLEVQQQDGRFFWAIMDWCAETWEEIPEYLFLALNRFQDERQQAAKGQVDG